ncbi:MAG: hypothetical protein ACRD3B_00455 [Candidatus Sulfotelmatobacter sp.]
MGCDFHPSVQQIALLDLGGGQRLGRKLNHGSGEAERFYRRLAGEQVRVGIENSGKMQ